MSIVEQEPSHGEQIHRRRVLAEARREPPPDREERRTADSKDDPIRLARVELRNIEARLSPDSETSMTPLDRASLEVEKIWLKFKVGDISADERSSRFQKKLNDLETSSPDVFDLLIRENGSGFTLLAKIRDKVIPPTEIGGFHTKRR